jgi:lipopolysaccharide/colanic/teichoic acid biosynthesis glycosyltransferase
MKPYQQAIKRLVDLIVSAFGLALSSPLFLLIALFIKLDSKGPALFRQTRVGKDGKPFTCYKFRTMYVDAPDIRNPDGATFNAEDDPRVTRAGRLWQAWTKAVICLISYNARRRACVCPQRIRRS